MMPDIWALYDNPPDRVPVRVVNSGRTDTKLLSADGVSLTVGIMTSGIFSGAGWESSTRGMLSRIAGFMAVVVSA